MIGMSGVFIQSPPDGESSLLELNSRCVKSMQSVALLPKKELSLLALLRC
jgi:hypothetical protein